MNRRPAAVAGFFYPAESSTLRETVAELLASAPASDADVKAIIAPHAGYQYSGQTAAYAYRLLESRQERIERVVLLGPAHRVYLEGMALPDADVFSTPMGDVAVDRIAVERALELPGTLVSDEAHAREHSLEVHLPFLQAVLGEFRVVPVVVGVSAATEVQALINALWGGDETLIVVSSDLSHHHGYDDANHIDAQTSARIEKCVTTLRGEEACGAYALNGLMLEAQERGLEVRTLDRRNSGDTAGDRNRVVGYGAYALA
jgi:AmmeMemoRadiSam system protein B